MINGMGEDEYSVRVSKTKLLSLEMRRLRSDLIEVFKIMHNLEGVKREDFFQLRTATGRRGHSLTILKQHCRLNVQKYFFTHRVVDNWNNLSADTVHSKTVDSFKNQIDTCMVQTRRGAIHNPMKASCSLHSDPQAHRNQLAEAVGAGKKLGTKNSKMSNEGRQAKNGGVKRRDGSAEELDRETGEEQITVGWTRRKDGGRQTTEESGIVT